MMLEYAIPLGPPPPAATAHDRAVERWLRAFLRPYARFCAMLAVTGEEEHEDAKVEFFVAAAQTAHRRGYSMGLAHRIALGEWDAALAAARNAIDAVIRAVRPRIFRRDPGDEVLRTACIADAQCIFPKQVLFDICSKVFAARARRRVRS